MSSQSAIRQLNITGVSRFFGVLGLIVFCFALGEVSAAFFTAVIFGIGTDEVFRTISDPANARADLLLTLSSLSALLRFLILPGVYLYLTNKGSLSFLRENNQLSLPRLGIVIVLFIAILPSVSALIEFNHFLKLPGWLSGVEDYFKESEARVSQLMTVILSDQGLQNRIMVIVVVAIIPGLAEEIFFRGIVQTKLYKVFTNPLYAVVTSAAIFSFFHFQFYGFIPRMAVGILLGYLFLRSGNIWYPIVGHIVNNTLTLLMAFYVGTDGFEEGNAVTVLLIIPSVLISAFIIWRMSRSKWSEQSQG